MPTKFQLITELYDQTVQSVTGSYQSWTGFLRAACYNYKCPFDDQILIYAQRPDATAVLEMERWNRQFGRWVNRGAKSIAVFGDDGQNCLKLYFDVSDTHASRFARPLPIWTMHPAFEPEVIETLEATFGNLAEKENLADAVRSACHNAVADNITDYLQDLRDCREDSLLEELDDLNLEVFYRDALEVSVAYMLMTRLGLPADEYFSPDEFAHVYEFNTPTTINALGIATSDIAEMGLREISRTVMQAQRDQFFANREKSRYDDHTEQHETPHERSEQHGDHLQDAGWLSGAEPADAADAGGTSGQVRGTAESVPEEAPQGALHQPQDQRQADGVSGRDRADRAEDGGADRGADGESRGRDGGTESDRSPALDGADEQSPAQRGGTGTQRPDLRLTTEEPTEAGSDELPASAVIDAAQPTIKELFEQYKQTVAAALVKNTAFVEQVAEDAARLAAEQPPAYERFSVIETDDGYAVWDDIRDEVYVDEEGVSEHFSSEWQAEDYLEQVRKAVSEKEAAEWLYVEQSRNTAAKPEQPQSEPVSTADPVIVGTRLTIDGRQFEVDSVDDHTKNVSLRDVTFEARTGFPIFRKESIDYVRAHMEQPDIVQETAAPQADEPPAALTPPKKKKRNALAYPLDADGRNYRITDDHIGEGAPLERFQHNLDAIRTLKTVEAENRAATAEEQAVLAQYVSWGGLADFFDEKNPRYAELKELLTDAEYAAARESTLTAFFTPPVVIRGIYAALGQMGFTQGNILEPSCGIGNFFGMLPENMSGSKLYGVELDDLSGRIARQLYQKSSVAVQGYEKTAFPDNFFDIAIGNVPFGQFHVADKRYDRLNFPIHEYFIAKALDQVRPGGVIAVVTSSYTMDKRTASARKYIAQRSELLGAIRLPNNAFKAAAGTEVVSDILFLQKRERMVDIEPEWVHLATNEDGIQMNSYFIDHPDMILGEMKMVSGPFGPTPTCEPYPEQPLEALLAEAVQNVHGEIAAYDREEELEGEDHSIEADPAVRNFSYTLVDGQIYYRENSRMNPVEVSKTAESRIRGMIELRDCVRTLLEYQTEDYPNEEIKAQQAKLNTLYDAFTRKYGLINSRGNAIAFDQDSSYFLLCSLEILDEDRNLKRKADLFTKRTIRSHKPAEKVDTAVEALALSIGEKAHVDMDYMSRLTGKDEETLFSELTGVVFLNPAYTGENDGHEKYLPADEYLSGNVRQKLTVAQGKAEQDPQYQTNADALAQVQPTDLTASEISVRLGATWLDTEYVRRFIFETLGTPRSAQWSIKVHYSGITGEWRIEGKSKDRGNVKAISTYGTKRINAYEIIEVTLNLKDVRIFDYVYDADGRKTAVLNKKETAIAQSKQELIKDAFAEWIWKDPDRREASSLPSRSAAWSQRQ